MPRRAGGHAIWVEGEPQRQERRTCVVTARSLEHRSITSSATYLGDRQLDMGVS